MKVLIVNHQEVKQWLSMNECMDVMAETLRMLNRGKAVNPLRHAMWLPDKSGLIGMMPAYLQAAGVIDDSRIFRLGVRYLKMGRSMKAGEFLFPPVKKTSAFFQRQDEQSSLLARR